MFKVHNSRPINRLIADSFFTMGLVETWGQGIEKICNGLKEANLQATIITPFKSHFIIEFNSKYIIQEGNDTVNYENDTVNQENDTVKSKK